MTKRTEPVSLEQWKRCWDAASETKMMTRTEQAWLLYLFSDCPGDIVEIGCNEGNTTVTLATFFKDRMVYAYDYVFGDGSMDERQEYERPSWESVCKLARNLPNVAYVNGDSRRLSLPVKVSCVFIDGDHSKSGVESDSHNAFSLYHARHSKGPMVIAWDDVWPREHCSEWLAVTPFLEAMPLGVVKIGGTKLAYLKL